jgi:RNA ligase-like protein
VSEPTSSSSDGSEPDQPQRDEPELLKYPRTPHLTGSRLQPGDEDLTQVARSALAGAYLVVEEKVDGANAAISFGPEDELLLQSRGHYLRGGGAERQFDLFKTWAQAYVQTFREVLGRRYVLYGEWLYAKHTVFYDALPHYFLEFDAYDRERGVFLATPERARLCEGLPLASVPVLARGPAEDLGALADLVVQSRFKSAGWLASLDGAAERLGQPRELVRRQTDPSPLSEGLYLKWEREGVVEGRYKLVRGTFLDQVQASGSHWADRPILPNQLAPGVELFA